MGTIGNPSAMRRLVEDARSRFVALLTPQQKTMLDAITGRGDVKRVGVGLVYVLADGRPKPVLVHIGASDGSFTEVAGRLNVGDPVIVGGPWIAGGALVYRFMRRRRKGAHPARRAA